LVGLGRGGVIPLPNCWGGELGWGGEGNFLAVYPIPMWGNYPISPWGIWGSGGFSGTSGDAG